MTSARTRSVAGDVLALLVGAAIAFVLDMWWDDKGWQDAALFAVFVMACVAASQAVVKGWQAMKAHRAAGH
ncbi:MAG TPA: hypothetical protein VE442_08320 [Jatrophihabitans sp.]|nr:hypothetical protein [Jatrophihabitans sp.]